MPPILVIDAFTDAAFAGNPASVCLLDAPVPAEWMQRVAAEMNHSETAFLVPNAPGIWGLRWFTPGVEVDLCGHATLASAHALWTEGIARGLDELAFETRSGRLTARRAGDWIELDFPADPVTEAAPPDGLLDALGISKPSYAGKARFDWLIEIANESALAALTPDLKSLAPLTNRGVIVTCRSARDGIDFASRFFAPAAGVDEDPVTGSAHCTLAGYWAPKLGLEELVGFQMSRRGGIVRVRRAGDRVVLSGQAVTVLRGSLLV